MYASLSLSPPLFIASITTRIDTNHPLGSARGIAATAADPPLRGVFLPRSPRRHSRSSDYRRKRARRRESSAGLGSKDAARVSARIRATDLGFRRADVHRGGVSAKARQAREISSHRTAGHYSSLRGQSVNSPPVKGGFKQSAYVIINLAYNVARYYHRGWSVSTAAGERWHNSSRIPYYASIGRSAHCSPLPYTSTSRSLGRGDRRPRINIQYLTHVPGRSNGRLFSTTIYKQQRRDVFRDHAITRNHGVS